jgi:aromatic-L-amino-acid decarboxylase
MGVPVLSVDKPETGLDPVDWSEARAVAHRMVDDAIAYLQGIAETPCWRDPGPVEARFREPLPRHGMPLPDVYDTLTRELMP